MDWSLANPVGCRIIKRAGKKSSATFSRMRRPTVALKRTGGSSSETLCSSSSPAGKYLKILFCPCHQSAHPDSDKYYLVREPQQLERIHDELASINIRAYKAIQRLQHMNACIYETLRLNPAVPSAGLRVAPPGGLVVSDIYPCWDHHRATIQFIER